MELELTCTERMHMHPDLWQLQCLNAFVNYEQGQITSLSRKQNIS